MVKTRSDPDGVRFREYMKDLHDKFGKTLTHRKVTETVNSEGQVTNRSVSDNTFIGDLQYGTNIDKKLIEAGWVDHGEGVLYVSAEESQASLIMPDVSIIIEGSTPGTYDAWVVVERLSVDMVKGVAVAYVFRCKKRTQETIT